MSDGAPTLRGDLLDVNVWFALAVQDHVHHAAATAYWHESPQTSRYFCRISASSLVRLLTHPGLMAGKALGLQPAWRLYERFRALPSVDLVAEPPGVEKALSAMITPRLPTRLFTDAYFAALAGCTGLRLVSFDRDFARFTNLQWQHLDAGVGQP
jgi:toxin-antitoxin system PIN domain toxin